MITTKDPLLSAAVASPVAYVSIMSESFIDYLGAGFTLGFLLSGITRLDLDALFPKNWHTFYRGTNAVVGFLVESHDANLCGIIDPNALSHFQDKVSTVVLLSARALSDVLSPRGVKFSAKKKKKHDNIRVWLHNTVRLIARGLSVRTHIVCEVTPVRPR